MIPSLNSPSLPWEWQGGWIKEEIESLTSNSYMKVVNNRVAKQMIILSNHGVIFKSMSKYEILAHSLPASC
jgi:hypothetical protein